MRQYMAIINEHIDVDREWVAVRNRTQHLAEKHDEEDEEEKPWDPHTDYHDDDYEDRHLEEDIRQVSFVKFWIRPDGKVEMMEPGEHHVYALERLSSAEQPLSWFGCFKSGWVRGFYEPEGTMNYCFTEKSVTPAAIKAMLSLAREYRATSYNLEEAIHDTQIGGSELDPRQFSIYMRSKSRADGAPLNESEADFKVWHTITDSYHGQLDGYCQAESVPDRRAIGYLNFSVFEGRALIKMIEVNENWKRKGVGSALIDCLVRDMKGYENIDWGYTTPDGEALRLAYESR